MFVMLEINCSPKEAYDGDILSQEEFDCFVDNTNTLSLRFYRYFHILENSLKDITTTNSLKVDLLEDIKKELEKM